MLTQNDLVIPYFYIIAYIIVGMFIRVLKVRQGGTRSIWKRKFKEYQRENFLSISNFSAVLKASRAEKSFTGCF